jgi:hypothetical protein
MSPKNRVTVDTIKSEVESVLSESNNIDKSRNSIWSILDDKCQRKEIVDYRLVANGLSKEKRREFTLQSLLDEIDPLCEPPLNEFNITLKLPSEMDYINLKIVQMI